MAKNDRDGGNLKRLEWAGPSKDELLSLPEDVQQGMGYQLHRLQTGREPQDWKPLTGLGKGVSGVYEIRLSLDGNIFRTAYVAKFSEMIVVLHCWQKKTQATARRDKELIVARYRSAKERYE